MKRKQIPIPKSATVSTKQYTVQSKEAEKAMREMLTQIDNQAFVKNNNTTVKEFLTEWLNVFIIPAKAATTTKGYTDQLKRYVYPTIGNKKLQELKSVDIQKLYNQLRIKSPLSEKPLSSKTIRNIHMNLLAAFDKAVEQELITKNPAKLVQLPKIPKYKADVYSMDEIKELFELVKGTDLELPTHILILLGLRRGELCGLRWSHVNFNKKTVNIVENAVMVNQDVIIKDPKSESGIREIGIPDSLVFMMKKAYTEYLLRRNANPEIDDFVIVKEDGMPYKPSSFSNKVRRFLNKSDLKRIRLHDMRHTSATLMLQLGIPAKVAQKRLGHADFSTTMDIYSHVLENIEQEAVERIDNAFSEKIKHG